MNILFPSVALSNWTFWWWALVVLTWLHWRWTTTRGLFLLWWTRTWSLWSFRIFRTFRTVWSRRFFLTSKARHTFTATAVFPFLLHLYRLGNLSFSILIAYRPTRVRRIFPFRFTFIIIFGLVSTTKRCNRPVLTRTSSTIWGIEPVRRIICIGSSKSIENWSSSTFFCMMVINRNFNVLAVPLIFNHILKNIDRIVDWCH